MARQLPHSAMDSALPGMSAAAGLGPSGELVRIVLPVIFAGAWTLSDLRRADVGTRRHDATAAAGVSNVTAKPQDAVVAIPFSLHSGFLIVVEGAIGKLDRLTFIVDTGHHQTTIDRRVARKLGLTPGPAQLEAFGRRIAAGRLVVPWVKVGPLKSLDLPVLVTDLVRAGGATGLQADAIIGLDVLLGTCIGVDYRRRMLTFGRVATWDFGLAFESRSQYPVIQASIDGVSYRLLVDTGAEMTLIFSDAIPPRHRVAFDGEIEGDHLAGTVSLRRFTAGRVRLGGFELRGVSVFVVAGGTKLPYEGLLGSRWLTSTRLQIDLERMVLSWDK
jgi:predicted aspartyl protease